jgi:L-aspartate oxidase
MPHHSDVLVIGSGVAGCATALAAADAGLQVTMLTNAPAPDKGSSTSWAQGGIIYTSPEDSPGLLAKDIQIAGTDICSLEAVRQLSERGPELVKKVLIERCGVAFDRNAAGNLDLTEEAAHSVQRILHVGDLTGEAIARAMGRTVAAHPNVRIMTNATGVDLILTGNHTADPRDYYKPPQVLGAYVFNQDDGSVEPFVARETVLATGGLGQVFLHTTNPKRARGDGLAMAYRAGAWIVNLEYIQFHPTALYHRFGTSLLISETVRGEGGKLIGADGKAFMHKYDPREELAPRDVVARALHEEMLATGEPCMYLDISFKDRDWIIQRFPFIHKSLMEFNIDMTRQPIPVVPAAHYCCGGVLVDLVGRTTIKGLRAVGEVSCTGLHGANRLASTSLLEGLVWGVATGEDIAQHANENGMPTAEKVVPWKMEDEEVDPALVAQDWMSIRQTMWNYVGLVRTTRRMHRALRILRDLQFDVELFYRRARLNDELIGLRNGAQAALAIVHAAYRNRKSRGGHFRKDD